jgi:hypothetical protein
MPVRSHRGLAIFFILAAAIVIFAGIRVRNAVRQDVPPPPAVVEKTPLDTGLSRLGDLRGGYLGTLGFVQDLDRISSELPQLIFEKRGADTLALLRSLREKLRSIENVLQKSGDIASYFLPDSLRGSVADGGRMLDAIIAFADTSSPRHIIILLSNTSELRPGGGFTGSFAVAEIKNGAMSDLAFHDVNEADRELAANIIPPKPLQAIVARWRAADANWFFSFPASAEKTLSLLERSGFTPRGTRYDGLVSISPAVISDILAATGPVTISGNRTIDKDNFLTFIQGEVQAGQAAGTADPKAVLGELIPVLQAKLAAIDGKALTAKLPDWVAHKDLLIYMRDSKIAEGLKEWNADGSLYDLSEGPADYLGVVNANVGGGKTDIVMQDSVNLRSDIAADGTINNELILRRKHDGSERSEWWYQVPNWDYVQIFLPDGAKVTRAEGAGTRTTTPKADYRNFETDPDVANLEATLRPTAFKGLDMFRESGKTVFATWLRIDKGEERVLTLDYSLATAPVTAGPYIFVYEAPQGSRASLHLELTAPGEMVFENGERTYVYDDPAPPGRLVLKLGLENR